MEIVNIILRDTVDVPSHLKHEKIEWIKVQSTENCLIWKDNLLSYLPAKTNQNNELPIMFDFSSKLKYHASRHYNLKKELLAKALGINQQNSLTVIDGSLGTGKDAMLILSFGAKVVGHERNPIVYSLLQDAMMQAQVGRDGPFLKENLKLHLSNCHRIELLDKGKDQVFYFDPMFKKMKHKSKSKKDMEIFKYLVGADEDYIDVLEWAMEQKFSRVVLKRSVHDDIYKKPTACFKGKTIRYDMYSLNH
jgi:16S rRNA (guanine1516-N2)-methyltransferase